MDRRRRGVATSRRDGMESTDRVIFGPPSSQRVIFIRSQAGAREGWPAGSGAELSSVLAGRGG